MKMTNYKIQVFKNFCTALAKYKTRIQITKIKLYIVQCPSQTVQICVESWTVCLVPFPNTNANTNYKDQVVHPRQWKYVFKKVWNLQLDCLSGALPKYQWPFRISSPPFSFYYGSSRGCVFAQCTYVIQGCLFLHFCSTFQGSQPALKSAFQDLCPPEKLFLGNFFCLLRKSFF